MRRHNVPPLVEIGLTDLPKTGWAIAHPAHPPLTTLCVMEVVVLTHAQLQEIVTPKLVQVSIFLCFCSIRTNAPSYLIMRIYLPKKKK